MDADAHLLSQLARTSTRLAGLCLVMAGNRVELLMVALQEERQKAFRAILLVLGMSVLGLLAGIALTAAVAVLWWDHSPVGVLLTLTGVYAVVGLILSLRLRRLLRDWQVLSTLVDQVREDRASLEQTLT